MINRFIGVKVNGLENLKNLEGNVLFIANHNSFLDAVLIWAFIPEKLCFTISPLVAKKWWVKPFLHLAKFFLLIPQSLCSKIDNRRSQKRQQGCHLS
jgi:acyl-[acyl-carrier-protein]-phospholipid O-acyltransferase/long-chain-fatty-acid--[acyl-carrier-protein] ligase